MEYKRITLEVRPLYVDVDTRPTRVRWAGFNVVGEDLIRPTHTPSGSYVDVVFVHVMSPAAGGEVRGYAVVDGVAHLRLPATPREWMEVDESVARATGLSVLTEDDGGALTIVHPRRRRDEVAR